MEPMRVWHLVGMAAGAVVLLLLLLRTGNDPGVGVSPLELKIRAIMDRVLYVRPRTKEFLVGHPAMLLALWAGLAGRRRLWVPLLLVGAIGQVSLLNTFCHIHTPLTLSLIRAGNGMLLGILLGAVLVWVVARQGHFRSSICDLRRGGRPPVENHQSEIQNAAAPEVREEQAAR